MQRSLTILRRIHGSKMVLNKFTHQPLLKPQCIAIRKYVNPDADYMELSETAWKEKRLYRYYKFSNNVSATTQQRGYAQGIFVILGYVVSFAILGVIDYETCVQYRNFRAWRSEEIHPWLRAARAAGYWHPWNYSKDKMNEMYDVDLPEIQAKHDGRNKREWKKNLSLQECLKREAEFDSPFHYENVATWMPKKAYAPYQKWLRGEEQRK